jgi:hypothetical protein
MTAINKKRSIKSQFSNDNTQISAKRTRILRKWHHPFHNNHIIKTGKRKYYKFNDYLDQVSFKEPSPVEGYSLGYSQDNWSFQGCQCLTLSLFSVLNTSRWKMTFILRVISFGYTILFINEGKRDLEGNNDWRTSSSLLFLPGRTNGRTCGISCITLCWKKSRIGSVNICIGGLIV